MKHDESHSASSWCHVYLHVSQGVPWGDESGHLAIVLPTQYARGCTLYVMKGAGRPTE